MSLSVRPPCRRVEVEEARETITVAIASEALIAKRPANGANGDVGRVPTP